MSHDKEPPRLRLRVRWAHEIAAQHQGELDLIPALVAALRDTVDALRTYGPEFVHGEPKSAVIKRAERAIARAKAQP